jgi:hypothetical protein
MKLTLTNRGTGGKRLWISDTGLTCIHCTDNNVEVLSIVSDNGEPTLKDIAEARYTIMSEAKSYAIVFGPRKNYNSKSNVVTLIEHKL